MAKLRESKGFVRERIVSPETLRKQGFTRFRTKTQGEHKLIIAAKGSKTDGETRVQAILHPKSEFPKGTARMERTK